MAWRDELYAAITGHPEYQLALRLGLTGDQFRQLVDYIRPPAGEPAPATGDQIDLSQVRWLHTDVSSWAITSELTRITMAENQVCLYHSKAGRWPAKNGVEGNPWVFARFGNVWHAATYEWLRPGQQCKGVTRSGPGSIGRHTKRQPFIEWAPMPGEEVGWMVSGLARDRTRNIHERTQVLLTRWP